MLPAINLADSLTENETLALYRSVGWSAAEKPTQLMTGLRGAHSLATARIDGRLIGLGSAISDGSLVVYYPHLLVHPDFQGRGIGRLLVEALQARYNGFHQQQVVADGDAAGFYAKLGFRRSGQTVPMWIYSGRDH